MASGKKKTKRQEQGAPVVFVYAPVYEKTAAQASCLQMAVCMLSGLWQMIAPGLNVLIRLHAAMDWAMLLLKAFDAFAHQHKHLAVDGATLIVGDIADLFQHFILKADRYAFHGHIAPQIDILRIYFRYAMR